jgi:hypothetical protein
VSDCSHPCLWCGTNGPNDFEEEVSDDEDRAWAIRDDLALAMVNKCASAELSEAARVYDARFWSSAEQVVKP